MSKSRLNDLDAENFRTDSLVGSYFHGDHERGWQGAVVAEVASRTYLVQLFSWFDGSSTNQELVELGEMKGWTFYDSSEQMNERAETARGRWKREAEEQGELNRSTMAG